MINCPESLLKKTKHAFKQTNNNNKTAVGSRRKILDTIGFPQLNRSGRNQYLYETEFPNKRIGWDKK